jgi:hypothetical protein
MTDGKTRSTTPTSRESEGVGFPIRRARRDAGPAGTVTRFEASIEIAAPTSDVYELVSDISRTGEWSPVCVGCSWDDPAVTSVGAWFAGENETDGQRWWTRSQVVVAEAGREFAWVVGGGYVRWGYRLNAIVGDATQLAESWQLLPAGLTMFRDKYRADADARIGLRTRQAAEGIPATLAAIKGWSPKTQRGA